MSALAHFPLHVVRRAWIVRRVNEGGTLFFAHLSAEDGESRTEPGSLHLVIDKLMEPGVRLGLPIILEDAGLRSLRPALSQAVAQPGRPFPRLLPFDPYGGRAA